MSNYSEDKMLIVTETLPKNHWASVAKLTLSENTVFSIQLRNVVKMKAAGYLISVNLLLR